MYAKLLELKGNIFNYHSLGTKSAFYKISYSNGTNKWWLKDKMKMQQVNKSILTIIYSSYKIQAEFILRIRKKFTSDY